MISYNRPIQLKLYDKLLSKNRCQVAGTRPKPRARKRAQSQPLRSKLTVIQDTEVKTKKITCKDLDFLWAHACVFEYVQVREHSAYETDPRWFNLTCLINPRLSPAPRIWEDGTPARCFRGSTALLQSSWPWREADEAVSRSKCRRTYYVNSELAQTHGLCTVNAAKTPHPHSLRKIILIGK